MTVTTLLSVAGLLLAVAAFVRHPSGRSYLRVAMDVLRLTA